MSHGDQALHIRLELDADPDALHGTFQHGDGTRQSFWGWLELMSALDRLTRNREDDRQPPADERTDR
jgi:hypothetical protein